MALKFGKLTKHGKFEFMPGVAYGFEDPDAEPYFLALEWAKTTSDEPVRVYSIGEVDIDPLTIRASNGKHVLPDRAKEQLAKHAEMRARGEKVVEPQVTIRPKG